MVPVGAPSAKPPATAVGTEDDIGARALEASAPAFAEWNSDIIKRVSKAGSADAAASALDEWASKARNDDAVQRSIYESVMLAAMGGALHVRLVEAPETASGRALARFVALAADGSLPSGPGGPNISFVSLPFDEAMADFLARQIVTPQQFAAMDAAARQRAFTAAGLATDALRDEAYRGILAALEEGTTLRDFAAELRSGERSLGITPSDPAYIETVFRTNIAQAYAAGRHEQMNEPAVIEAFPGIEFRAIIDGRTTSQCRYCNGLQWDRVADPGWVKYAPPLHFNCRSTTKLLRRSQMEPSRLIHSSDVDERGNPAPGFGGVPTLGLDA